MGERGIWGETEGRRLTDHEERNSREKTDEEGFLRVSLCDVRQNFPFCQDTAAKRFLRVLDPIEFLLVAVS